MSEAVLTVSNESALSLESPIEIGPMVKRDERGISHHVLKAMKRVSSFDGTVLRNILKKSKKDQKPRR